MVRLKYWSAHDCNAVVLPCPTVTQCSDKWYGAEWLRQTPFTLKQDTIPSKWLSSCYFKLEKNLLLPPLQCPSGTCHISEEMEVHHCQMHIGKTWSLTDSFSWSERQQQGCLQSHLLQWFKRRGQRGQTKLWVGKWHLYTPGIRWDQTVISHGAFQQQNVEVVNTAFKQEWKDAVLLTGSSKSAGQLSLPLEIVVVIESGDEKYHYKSKNRAYLEPTATQIPTGSIYGAESIASLTLWTLVSVNHQWC